MKIAHIALWTNDLEAQIDFWQTYFSGLANEKYISLNNLGFESYFIHLSEGATIELMTKPNLLDNTSSNNTIGWAHIAISVGSKSRVDEIAAIAECNGILNSRSRLTGDGYYEAIITDPDGNLVEIVSE